MKFNYNLITTTRLLLLTLYRNQLHNEVTSSIVSPHSGNTGFRKDRNLMEASERYWRYNFNHPLTNRIFYIRIEQNRKNLFINKLQSTNSLHTKS